MPTHVILSDGIQNHKISFSDYCRFNAGNVYEIPYPYCIINEKKFYFNQFTFL